MYKTTIMNVFRLLARAARLELPSVDEIDRVMTAFTADVQPSPELAGSTG